MLYLLLIPTDPLSSSDDDMASDSKDLPDSESNSSDWKTTREEISPIPAVVKVIRISMNDL